MRAVRKRITYANVMSSIAGVKIKADAITGDKVKDGSLTGSDINVSTLGNVPSAS